MVRIQKGDIVRMKSGNYRNVGKVIQSLPDGRAEVRWHGTRIGTTDPKKSSLRKVSKKNWH